MAGCEQVSFTDFKNHCLISVRSIYRHPIIDERYISRDVDMTPISGLFDDIVPVLIQCRLPSISGISKKLQCCGQIFQKYRKSYNVG